MTIYSNLYKYLQGLAEQEAALAEKDAKLADQAATIAALKKQLALQK